MRKRQVFTATDLGPGDGGKGGVVHKLCEHKRAHTVLKVGGAQGSHGVRTDAGEKFNFSQFGCGTFNGAKTHITNRFVMDPNGLLNEASALRYECGIRNILELITVDQDALCITPFHGVASRLRECARKNNPKGTIGIGVGEAFYDAELHPELALYARDCTRRDLRDRIEAVRQQKIRDLDDVIRSDFWEADRHTADENIGMLHDPLLVDWTVERFREMAGQIQIVDQEYLRNILRQDGVVVVESSHGVLTDRYYGFHPHTSKLRTIPERTLSILRECDYDGEVIKLGVTRAYQIRHGAGPMVTHDPAMGERLLPGSSKDENRYQGKVRVGPLDFVALRYAIDVCGGPTAFDGLAITWLDQIITNDRFTYCPKYSMSWNPEFFFPGGRLQVSHLEGDAQLERQGRLTQYLSGTNPIVETVELNRRPAKESIALCRRIIEEQLGVPVRMVSIGPTEYEKILC